MKKVIESTQGQNVYPADQQVLIHQGKVLKDDSTMEENQVLEDNFLVIMLRQVGYLLILMVIHDKNHGWHICAWKTKKVILK